MSERKVDIEIVRRQYTNDTSLIDRAEIIDVSAFDFDSTDGWLYSPVQTECVVYDLDAWLKDEPELNLSAGRKSVDTRTFTRSKKRSSRISFESIFETLSSPVANMWKTSNCLNLNEDLHKYSNASTANKNEIIPSMLNMASIPNISFLADEAVATSGQESMEVFLNMSHSKGIDSFINLMEPGLNDPLMNVSQPSLFCSSITSLPRDDSLLNTDCDKEEEAVNLTDIHNQESAQCKDINNLNINDTFSKSDRLDNNGSYCLNTEDITFTNKSDSARIVELNETYLAEEIPAVVGSSKSDKDKLSTINLSSAIVNKDDGNVESLDLRSSEKKSLSSLNTTYTPTPHKANDAPALDTTYSAIEIEKPATDATSTFKVNRKRDKDQPRNLQATAACNTFRDATESSMAIANSPYPFMSDDMLNTTFKLSIPLGNQSTPKNIDALKSTLRATNNKHLDPTRTFNTTWSSNLKGPTSLRKELLAEIHRSGEHRLDCTYNHTSKEDHQTRNSMKNMNKEVPSENIKSDTPAENKYNTYRKESSADKMKSRAETVNEIGTDEENLQDKKYYTFTKKASTHVEKIDTGNAESLENMDATFVKPLPKLQKRKQQQQNIPRMLSKLPQILQKSNPNLVSNSLRTVNMTGYSNPSAFGYMKGSQPNIIRNVDKSLTRDQLYPFGKLKSGSEQRLLELNAGVGELELLGAGGSTESIESTQSAHSAPDLDDRLSTCSDSSHNSCSTQPMNIEQLQQIVRMQEESLKEDAMPQLNKRLLETTWVDVKKNLPSPINKNGVDSCESDGSSPLSMDCSVKTSSPILSPIRSSQSINTDGQAMETVIKSQNDTEVVKKVEVFNKPLMKIENKTRLRQPTNWNSGNRPLNVTSAIPRPASRIPAPRFARPAVKSSQGDTKRGHA